MLSRYQPGMAYGTHADEALINEQRTDISFTVFLSASDEYQGGELVLEDSSGERSWKLNAGDVLLYPATYLHRVNKVEQGERLVVVGWVTSWLRDAGQRELLFDLELSLREEFDSHGKTAQYDRLSKVRNNLLRMWLER
ncbi:MAG: Fe2+-dependent dioxygenase, partial [Methylophaga sp.]